MPRCRSEEIATAARSKTESWISVPIISADSLMVLPIQSAYHPASDG